MGMIRKDRRWRRVQPIRTIADGLTQTAAQVNVASIRGVVGTSVRWLLDWPVKACRKRRRDQSVGLRKTLPTASTY